MIVALARKLLIALWRMVTTGEVPRGVVLRQAVWTADKKFKHRVAARPAMVNARLVAHDPRWWWPEPEHGHWTVR
jgi:hypothetical protein